MLGILGWGTLVSICWDGFELGLDIGWGLALNVGWGTLDFALDVGRGFVFDVGWRLALDMGWGTVFGVLLLCDTLSPFSRT